MGKVTDLALSDVLVNIDALWHGGVLAGNLLLILLEAKGNDIPGLGHANDGTRLELIDFGHRNSSSKL